MNRIGKWSKALSNIALIGQLGLSLIMPLLMMLALCWFLTDRLGWGTWVYIPGFILGLGAGFMTGYKVYLSEKSKADKEKDRDQNTGTAFNRHH